MGRDDRDAARGGAAQMHGAVVWASGRRWIGPSVGFDRDTEPAREIGLGVVRLAGRPARRGIGGWDVRAGAGAGRGSYAARAVPKQDS